MCLWMRHVQRWISVSGLQHCFRTTAIGHSSLLLCRSVFHFTLYTSYDFSYKFVSMQQKCFIKINIFNAAFACLLHITVFSSLCYNELGAMTRSWSPAHYDDPQDIWTHTAFSLKVVYIFHTVTENAVNDGGSRCWIL